MASNQTQPRTVLQQACQSCRTVLIGDTAVGKSSIAIRFVKGSFYEHEVPTIGAAFLTKNVQTDEEKVVKLEIWDTAGQERFHSLVPMYYRKAKAAIVVFDITDKSTFEGAKRWIKELQRMADPQMAMTLVGNKCDLKDQRLVDFEEAESFAIDNGLLYVETSAKTNFNVDTLFNSLVNLVSTQPVIDDPSPTNGHIPDTSPCFGGDTCRLL